MRGAPSGPPRIGILVVAYNAGSTIQAVLGRIPPATWEKITEVFIFDDASRDDTCERAALFRGSPWAAKVRILRNAVKPGGRIVASTGNVAHLYVCLALLFGRFTYTERGLLDRTHFRLFTRNVLPGRPRLADALAGIDMAFGRIRPGLFAYQSVIEAQVDERAPTDLLRQTQLTAPYEEWEGRPLPSRGSSH
jgi:hypothetical protein